MSIEEPVVSEGKLNQYLTFVLDKEEYGVPILTVMGSLLTGWSQLRLD